MRPRRTLVASAILSMTLGVTSRVHAAEDPGAVPEELPRLVLDSGRHEIPAPEPGTYRFFIHGEHQLRFQATSSFPMVATASAIDSARPGLTDQSLKQNAFVSHWLRLTPRLQLEETVEVVGQLDVVTGMLLGKKARGVSADDTPRDAYDGFSNVQPRWLYLQWRSSLGVLRVGQQPNHWGMGILANDGDHPSLFGDYRYGSISERVLFATKPFGRASDFYLALAADLVFRDNTARLSRGDVAVQAVLAAFYERPGTKLGVFSTARHQERDRTSGGPAFPYEDELDALAVDVHGRHVFAVPGGNDTFGVAEAEVAAIFGSTNVLRTAEQARTGSTTDVRSYGGAVALGFVHRAYARSGDPGAARKVPRGSGASASELGGAREGAIPYGDFVANVELGYASGDADPHDGTHRRFVFDPNHRVGLLLFDELLRFQTARASTAATDPLLSNSERPQPGTDLLPSNGGILGAQYINPTFLFRPEPWLDLKAGAVVAQATSDVVDPYRLTTQGSYLNARGGDPRKKDLGVELDVGFEARKHLQHVVAVVGAQGGLLFPGGAFENAHGVRLPTQWITVGRLGLLF